MYCYVCISAVYCILDIFGWQICKSIDYVFLLAEIVHIPTGIPQTWFLKINLLILRWLPGRWGVKVIALSFINYTNYLCIHFIYYILILYISITNLQMLPLQQGSHLMLVKRTLTIKHFIIVYFQLRQCMVNIGNSIYLQFCYSLIDSYVHAIVGLTAPTHQADIQ